MPDGLEIREVEPGLVVVVLEGEHDLSSAPQLRAALLEAADKHVVVELSIASFIDSTILGAVIGGLRRAREQGRGFALVVSDPSTPVGRTLEVSGLLRIFPAYPTRDEAVAAARAAVNAPPAFAGESAS